MKRRAIVRVVRGELTEQAVADAAVAAGRPVVAALVVPDEDMAARARLVLEDDDSLFAGAKVLVKPAIGEGQWAAVL